MSDQNSPDVRPPRFAAWLAEPMKRNRATFIKVGIAAAMINIFALITSLFTMTVYDRVVPNLAFDSLTVLAIGVAIVIIFDFVLRILRAYFIDIAGVDMDRDIGDSVFNQMMRTRLDARRGSTGQLAGLMRELETLRDFFASATLTAVVDVPFILLTLICIAFIGGWIVMVPLVTIPIVVGAGWLSQPALDRLASRSMAGGLNKQSVLVESIGAMEMVKTSGATPMLRKRWLKSIDDQADAALRQRLVSNIAVTIASSANTIAYMGVVVVGVFLVADRNITTGGIVACSILAGRVIQPLAQIAMLLSRLSLVRTAYRQLDRLMQSAPEGPKGQALKPARLKGKIELRKVDFRYPGAAEKSLDDFNLTIEPGQKVALIGRVGSGKSTAAKLMLGLYEAQEGLVMIDGTDVRQLDPISLRANIGTALQEPVLLSGSVRDNIALDRPNIDDEEMLRASEVAGAHAFIGRIANGYDLVLADRGEGLSGGQRQALTLARALAGKPSVLIFDEPTSGMDAGSEAQLIERLSEELKDRTVVIVTHRTALLRLVDRIVVVEGGKVTQDGPRDTVLQALQRPRAAA